MWYGFNLKDIVIDLQGRCWTVCHPITLNLKWLVLRNINYANYNNAFEASL